jgi:periplasmic divalent cation tolerance protein
MTDQPIVVYVTAPSIEVGKEIAAALLAKKLAACVNIVAPVHSLYLWENKTQEDQEALLIIKSRSALLEGHLIPTVLAIHPYELPEIIALPILAGHLPYLSWIERETRQT